MRSSVRRALALIATVPCATGALLLATPAAHATHGVAAACGAGSTVLVDFYTLGGFHTRIASYDVSPTVTNICVEVLGTGQAVFVVKSGTAITPPSVSQTPGTGTCATRIIDMTAPTTLVLSAGTTPNGPAICIGQNGVTTTISLNAASVQALPDIDVWTSHNTYLNIVACPIYLYPLYVAGLNDGSAYRTCLDRDNQLV